MTTREKIREKIREGIDKVIQHWSPLSSVSANWAPLYGGASVGQDVQLYLHSQGVVIKVDRELPTVAYTITAAVTLDESMVIEKAYRKAYAGYAAVEPLIYGQITGK